MVSLQVSFQLRCVSQSSHWPIVASFVLRCNWLFCWILGAYRFSVRSRGESLCLQVLIISNYLLFTWHFSIHLLEKRHIVSYFPHLLSFVNHFPFQLLLVVSQFQNETNRVINLYHVKSLHYLFCCFCIGVLLESKGHLRKRFFCHSTCLYRLMQTDRGFWV